MTLPRSLTVVGLGIGLAGAAFVWGFALRPLFDRWAAAQQEAPETSGQLWTCGMHPQVIQPKPGSWRLAVRRLKTGGRTDRATTTITVQRRGGKARKQQR